MWLIIIIIIRKMLIKYMFVLPFWLPMAEICIVPWQHEMEKRKYMYMLFKSPKTMPTHDAAYTFGVICKSCNVIFFLSFKFSFIHLLIWKSGCLDFSEVMDQPIKREWEREETKKKKIESHNNEKPVNIYVFTRQVAKRTQ